MSSETELSVCHSGKRSVEDYPLHLVRGLLDRLWACQLAISHLTKADLRHQQLCSHHLTVPEQPHFLQLTAQLRPSAGVRWLLWKPAPCVIIFGKSCLRNERLETVAPMVTTGMQTRSSTSSYPLRKRSEDFHSVRGASGRFARFSCANARKRIADFRAPVTLLITTKRLNCGPGWKKTKVKRQDGL